MPLAAIALGSNLPSRFGDPTANLQEAIRRIASLGQIRAVSTLYETAPVGYTGQPNFLNAALLLDTEIPPLALMAALLEIERDLGRDRSTAPAKGPRIIDLDLLLFGGLVLNHPAVLIVDHPAEPGGAVSSAKAQPALTLPHPEMASRAFVLAPLAEIAPNLIHPTTGLTIAQLLARLSIA